MLNMALTGQVMDSIKLNVGIQATVVVGVTQSFEPTDNKLNSTNEEAESMYNLQRSVNSSTRSTPVQAQNEMNRPAVKARGKLTSLLHQARRWYDRPMGAIVIMLNMALTGQVMDSIKLNVG